MVIYIDNKHVEPLDQHLRGVQHSGVYPAQREDAVRAILAAIEQEKEKSPYRLWHRAHQPQEKAP